MYICPSSWKLTLQLWLLQSVHAPYALEWQVEPAPEPRECIWNNMYVPAWQRSIRKPTVYVITFLTIVFYMIPIIAISAITTLENLEKILPFIKSITRISALNTVLQVSALWKLTTSRVLYLCFNSLVDVRSEIGCCVTKTSLTSFYLSGFLAATRPYYLHGTTAKAPPRFVQDRRNSHQESHWASCSRKILLFYGIQCVPRNYHFWCSVLKLSWIQRTD